ncbi:MAG: hypothetical protein AAB793_01545, partial [Patescibacteria group bacterium]
MYELFAIILTIQVAFNHTKNQRKNQFAACAVALNFRRIFGIVKYMKKIPDNQIAFYQSADGSVNIEVLFAEEN